MYIYIYTWIFERPKIFGPFGCLLLFLRIAEKFADRQEKLKRPNSMEICRNLKGFNHCQPMQHFWAENHFGAVDMTWRLGSHPVALLCPEFICCMVQCTPSIDPNLGCQTSGSARWFLVGFERVLAVSNDYPFG